MINLMPDEHKKQLKAAKLNVSLLNYFLVLLGAGVFLVFILYGSGVLLRQTEESAKQLIEANDTKADVFSETQTQIQELSGKLSDARTILDGQRSYSKILATIGQGMTPGTVIDEVSLTPAAIAGEPFVATIFATTSTATVELQESLERSGAFQSVSISSIAQSNAVEGYTVTASMTLTLKPEAGR